MTQDEIKALFDQQAATYDTQWAKTAPIRNSLHLLLSSMFAELPEDAKILCVGVGTGDELIYLATRNPGWTFTAVEPSGGMLIYAGKEPKKKAQRRGAPSMRVILMRFQGSKSLTPQPVSWCLNLFWIKPSVPDFSAKSLRGSNRMEFSPAPTSHQTFNRRSTTHCSAAG